MLIDANEGEGGVMNSEKVVEKPTLYVCLALCSAEAVRATIAVAYRWPLPSGMAVHFFATYAQGRAMMSRRIARPVGAEFW